MVLSIADEVFIDLYMEYLTARKVTPYRSVLEEQLAHAQRLTPTAAERILRDQPDVIPSSIECDGALIMYAALYEVLGRLVFERHGLVWTPNKVDEAMVMVLEYIGNLSWLESLHRRYCTCKKQGASTESHQGEEYA